MDALVLSSRTARVGILPSLGGNITGFRLVHPHLNEVPLLMEQPVKDFANTNWHMFFPGRSQHPIDGRFGVVPFEGKDVSIASGDPSDQLNGIHGPFAAMRWQVAGQTDDSVLLRLWTVDHPGCWPWSLHIERRFQLIGPTLTCTERYLNAGETNAPFAAGWHPFVPHWIPALGDPLGARPKLPELLLEADAVWRKRRVGKDDILLPDGPPDEIIRSGDRDFSSGRAIPLGLDDCFRRSGSRHFGLRWVGRSYTLRLTISTCSSYEFAVVYSPPVHPTPSRFGAHLAVEWQTAASNVLALHNLCVANVGYRVIEPGKEIQTSWAMTPELWHTK